MYDHDTKNINRLHIFQAPIGLTFGTHPSLRLLSSFCISSALFAAAIAARTRAFSSSVIKRPALPGTADAAAFGSSVCTSAFEEVFVTVVEIVDAKDVKRPSGVRNNDRAACRSYLYIIS